MNNGPEQKSVTLSSTHNVHLKTIYGGATFLSVVKEPFTGDEQQRELLSRHFLRDAFEGNVFDFTAVHWCHVDLTPPPVTVRHE